MAPWSTDSFVKSSDDCLNYLTTSFYGKCLNVGTGAGFSLLAMIKNPQITQIHTTDEMEIFNKIPAGLNDSRVIVRKWGGLGR